jgi:hypothetical protein
LIGEKTHVPPLRCAPVGMTRGRAVTFIESDQMGWIEEKQQVPPLRCAPVGMTRGRAVTFIESDQMGWIEEKRLWTSQEKRMRGRAGRR